MNCPVRTYLVSISVSLLSWSALADASQFFRVVGPTTSVITAFSTDGTVAWSNAVGGVTSQVQRATVLGDPTNWVDYVKTVCTGVSARVRLFDANAPTGMAYIPGGTFQMGNCMDPAEGGANELPVHTVTVSSFYMDKTLVSGGLWISVCLWASTNGYDILYRGGAKADDHPIGSLNWYDCVKWCNARSEMEGLVPCYTFVGEVFRRGDFDYGTGMYYDIQCDWSANGYRLPTEAEWEYAARGGLNGKRFPWGDTISQVLANYYGFYSDFFPFEVGGYLGYHPTYAVNGQPYTSPVDAFSANGYGLHDMAGNMGQWCWDNMGDYSADTVVDPRGPSPYPVPWDSLRVFRGGCWASTADGCRTSFRSIGFYASDMYSYFWSFGFRTVRGAP